MVLAQNRRIGQWNRTENAEISPQLYGQLIFSTGGKNIQWEKVYQMVLGNLVSHMQKNKTGPFSYTVPKNKLKLKT